MPALARRLRLGADFGPLEDRTLPAQFGIPWPDAQNLTISFPTDGTATPAGPSTASASLAGVPNWKREVLRAFQTWAVQTNLNVGLVADGGQPLGSPGAVQGDRRFGDVRVGAAALKDPRELAFAAPFSWTGTTLSGDVLFDSTQKFQAGNASNGFDLFTVALHEAGHVLGLPHSAAAGSAMNETYSYRTGLSAGDVAAVQALYGTRALDEYDRGTSSGGSGSGTNDTLATAVSLPRVSGSNSQFSAVGDISGPTDVDYFRITIPQGTSAFIGRLTVKGTSLLLAKYTVLAANGAVLATGAATDPLDNDLSVRVNNPPAGTYYVKLEGATAGVFGIGSYRLTADLTRTPAAVPGAVPTRPVLADGGSDDTRATATTLSQKTDTDARFDAVALASIESPTDIDYYKIRSANGLTGPLALNVLAWGAEVNPVWPAVRVYDKSGTPLGARLLANENGTVSLRVDGVQPNTDYYVQVLARAPGSVGQYYVGVDFNSFAAPATGAVATGLTGTGVADATAGLSVNQAGMFQLGGAAVGVLGGTQSTAGLGGVTIDLLAANGATVASLAPDANQPGLTQAVFLPVGRYTVRYRYRLGGAAVPVTLRYQFTVLVLTDPIGPSGSDVLGGDPPPPPPDPYNYGGNSDVQPTGLPIVF